MQVKLETLQQEDDEGSGDLLKVRRAGLMGSWGRAL